MKGYKYNKNSSSGFSIFLVLGVIAVGIYCSFVTIRYIYQHHQANSWVIVEGKVIESELKKNTNEDGKSTFLAKGRYQYIWKQKQYESDRVSFTVGADSDSSYHRRIAGILDRHKINNEPIRVLGNPNNPNDAVLDRNIRWKWLSLLILIAFCFTGAGVLGIRKLRYDGIL